LARNDQGERCGLSAAAARLRPGLSTAAAAAARHRGGDDERGEEA